MGFDTLKTSTAVIYSCYYVVFAAIIAPFAGFFASGLKRAYGIKDFGHTIQGYGGFTDRLDCIYLCGWFNYVLVSHVMFRDEISAEKVYYAILDLNS